MLQARVDPSKMACSGVPVMFGKTLLPLFSFNFFLSFVGGIKLGYSLKIISI